MKYGRTPHLPWSQGISDDDRVIKSTSQFNDIVITEKMDGENTTIHKNGCHARSLDSKQHPARDWVNNFSSNFRYLLRDGERIIGENMFAMHSIPYTDLESYFLGFAVMLDGVCLSWYDTQIRFAKLGICSVPVIYRGPFNVINFKTLPWRGEGYVVRNAGSFIEKDQGLNIAKFVRANHVQPNTKHWISAPVIKNLLKTGS